MRRIVLTLAGTVGGLASLIAVKAHMLPVDDPATAAGDAPPPAAVAAPPPAKPDPSSSGTGGSDTAATRTTTGTGPLVDNPYSAVQVSVTLTDGKITKVTIVKLVTKEPQSKRITGDAIPKLQTATIAANSADVDTVSGATYTSTSYRESLQAALDQARKK